MGLLELASDPEDQGRDLSATLADGGVRLMRGVDTALHEIHVGSSELLRQRHLPTDHQVY